MKITDNGLIDGISEPAALLAGIESELELEEANHRKRCEWHESQVRHYQQQIETLREILKRPLIPGLRTANWIRTEDELPPENFRVLGSRNGLARWCTLKKCGKWLHNMDGKVWEDSTKPTFWMMIPEEPKE